MVQGARLVASFRLAVLALAVLAVATPAAPARAQDPAAPPEPVFDEVVFEPLDTANSFVGLVDRTLYRGRLVVRGTGSGLVVINELDPEDYLKGMAEVPAGWPLEAQKAQAVAARSYLLSERAFGAWQGYGADICATDACQVYSGAERELGAPLWRQAVAETRGLVMVFGNVPINAKYHSTSGGTTRSNLEIFGSEVPYLQGVPDPEDVVSPYHHWVVTMPVADLEPILRAHSETNPPPGTLVEVKRQTSRGEPVTVVTEENGQRQQSQIDPVRFIIRVNNAAPSRYPDRYPGLTESGNGHLPLTLPDDEMTVRTENGVAIFDGRGWGHKVGMSQYGAKGKSERGWTFDQILGAYYSGVGMTAWNMPPTIRVLLGHSLDARRISSTGSFRITDGAGQIIEPSTLGGWEVVSHEGRVRLARPAGFDAPLGISTVTLVATASGPSAGGARLPAPVNAPVATRPSFAAQAVPGALRFTLSAPARIEASLEGPGGSRKLPTRVLDAGEREIRLGDLFNKVLPKPGSYRIRLVATDTRGGRVQTEVPLDVAANARASIPSSDTLFGVPVAAPVSVGPQAGGRLLPEQPAGGGGIPLAYIVAIAAVVGVAVGAWRVRLWLERAVPVTTASAPAPPPTLAEELAPGPVAENGSDDEEEEQPTRGRPPLRVRRRRGFGG